MLGIYQCMKGGEINLYKIIEYSSESHHHGRLGCYCGWTRKYKWPVTC